MSSLMPDYLKHFKPCLPTGRNRGSLEGTISNPNTNEFMFVCIKQWLHHDDTYTIEIVVNGFALDSFVANEDDNKWYESMRVAQNNLIVDHRNTEHKQARDLFNRIVGKA